MADFTVKTRFDFRFSRAAGAIDDAVDAGAAFAAALVKARARDLVPVRTGRLRDSIEIERERRAVYAVRAGAPYAGFVEFGTSRMDARPFMRPAVRDTRATALAELSKRAGLALRRIR